MARTKRRRVSNKKADNNKFSIEYNSLTFLLLLSFALLISVLLVAKTFGVY